MTKPILSEYFLKRLKEFEGILESPQIIANMNKNFSNAMLDKPIKKGLDNNEFLTTKNENIHYLPLSIGSSIFILLNNNKVVGATRVSQIKFLFKNKLVYIPSASEKIDSSESSVLLRLYSYIQEFSNCYIMTGIEQSIDSYNVWLKWIKNPSKYNIKNWWVLDFDTKETIDIPISSIWSDDKSYQKHRIIIEFK